MHIIVDGTHYVDSPKTPPLHTHIYIQYVYTYIRAANVNCNTLTLTAVTHLINEKNECANTTDIKRDGQRILKGVSILSVPY